jgi:hypothetical protein
MAKKAKPDPIRKYRYYYEDTTWRFGVLFLFDHKQAEVLRVLKRIRPTLVQDAPLGIDVLNGKHSARTLWHTDNAKDFVVCMCFPQRASHYGVLVHEIFHCVDRALRDGSSIRLSDDSDEAYAYALQKITSTVLNKLWSAK